MLLWAQGMKFARKEEREEKTVRDTKENETKKGQKGCRLET